MTSLVKKVFRSSGRKNGSKKEQNAGDRERKSSIPQPPPSPDLSTLTPEEMAILKDVFRRQNEFESEEIQRRDKLCDNLQTFEDEVRRQACQKGRLKQVDLRLCRLCFRTKFADGIGKVCFTCHKRVCNRCGSFKPRWNQKKNKMVKGKWQCNMCNLKRDVVAMTGIWYHGNEGRPAIPTEVFQKKLSISEISSSETDRAVPVSETDQGGITPRSDTDLINEEDDSIEKSDDVFGSTVMAAPRVKHSGSRRSSTRSRRRSSSYSEVVLDEEVDNEIDVDQFQRERQLDRLQRHSKRSRRRRRSGNNQDIYELTTSDSDRCKDRQDSSPLYCSSSTENWLSSDHEALSDRANWSSNRGSPRQARESRSRGLSKERKSHGKSKSPDVPWRECQERKSIDTIAEHVHSPNQKRRRPKTSANGHYINDKRYTKSSKPCESIQRQSVQSKNVPSVSPISHHRSPRNSLTSPRDMNRHREHRLSRDSRASHGSCTSRDSNFSRESFSHASSGDISPTKTSSQASISFTNQRHQDAHYSSSSSVFSERKTSVETAEISPEEVAKSKDYDVIMTPNTSTNRDEKVTSHTLALPRRNSSFSSNSLSPDMALIRNPRKKHRRQQQEGSVSPHRSGSVSPRKDHQSSDDQKNRNVYGRRMTLSHCENIFLPVTRRRSPINDTRPHAIILHRDKSDNTVRTNGLGMRVVGGRTGPDGSLGAYVTMVTKTGPAESQGIREGDQIMEWNGRSLVDMTFEEAKEIINQPGSIVQVSVIHKAKAKSTENINNSDLSLINWQPIIVRTETLCDNDPPAEEGLVLSRPKRRMLPKTPVEIKKDVKTISGSIWLQLDYDRKCQCLLVVLLRGEGIVANSGDDRRQPNPVAMLHLLPNRAQHDVRESEIKFFTSNPEWNETFIFPGINEDEFKDLALELTVWNFREVEDEFMGEVLLDLGEGPVNNTPTCFHLEDHDDNSSPLPYRKKSFSISEVSVSCTSPGTSEAYLSRNPSPRSSQSTRGEGRPSSQRTLPITPAHERMKDLCFTGKKTSSRDAFSSATSSPLHSPNSPAHEYHRNITSLFKKKLGIVARLSSSLIMGSYHKRDMVDHEETPPSMPRSQSYTEIRDMGLLKMPAQSQPRRSFEYSPKRFELLAPPHPASRSNSSAELLRDDPVSDDLAGLERDRPAPEGDDITSLLGPGQIPPKPSFETSVHGDIRLGFMVSKGQLEIDVVVVKGLVKSGLTTAPDTYVKTYLVEGLKTVQKKKTHTIRASFDPFFKKTIKYSACNIHGRCIKVNVWEKQKTFDKKQCLGEAVVKLDSLDLSQQTMAWYKLFPHGAVEYVSSESLNFW